MLVCLFLAQASSFSPLLFHYYYFWLLSSVFPNRQIHNSRTPCSGEAATNIKRAPPFAILCDDSLPAGQLLSWTYFCGLTFVDRLINKEKEQEPSEFKPTHSNSFNSSTSKGSKGARGLSSCWLIHFFLKNKQEACATTTWFFWFWLFFLLSLPPFLHKQKHSVETTKEWRLTTLQCTHRPPCNSLFSLFQLGSL